MIPEAQVDTFRESHAPFAFTFGLLTRATGIMPTVGLGAGPVELKHGGRERLKPLVEADAAAHAVPQRFALTVAGGSSRFERQAPHVCP